jgi:hypothetical protein
MVKLSLCLFKHHGMKMYGGKEVRLHTCLTLALDSGSGQLSSRPDRFTLRERSTGSQWTGDLVDPSTSLDAVD